MRSNSVRNGLQRTVPVSTEAAAPNRRTDLSASSANEALKGSRSTACVDEDEGHQTTAGARVCVRKSV